jgi:Transport and Golgi organisation 2
MCTLSFVPKSGGYLLAMNRDEKMARGHGCPPEIRRLGSVETVFPSRGNCGTWIGSNQYGMTLALLNWNIPGLQQRARRSRGLIIPQLLSSTTYSEINRALTTCEATDCAPFRLVAVVPSECTLLQLSWDGRRLRRTTRSWRIRHWFSSSASDIRAEDIRGSVCSRSSNDANVGSVSWLRRLHRSHKNGPGAFSMCVHRERVETLSYTEVLCTRDKVSMAHAIGSPCKRREVHTIGMRRLYSDVCGQQRIEDTDVCRV